MLKSTVSIDRLTILGDEVKDRFEQMINNNNFGFVERSSFAKFPYDKKYHMTDGSVLEHSKNQRNKAIRYDFNPNNINDGDKEKTHRRAINDCISTMKYPKLSRVDISIDLYDIDLSDYEIRHESVKTIYYKSGAGKLETLYIGASESDLRYRIYNKAEEQGIKDKKWWRVEVQLRRELTEAVFLNANPFELVKFVKPILNSVEDMPTRAMLFYLQENPDQWTSLSKPTRLKYKKILSTLQSEKEINVAEIYENSAERIQKELKQWLYIAQKNNVIS